MYSYSGSQVKTDVCKYFCTPIFTGSRCNCMLLSVTQKIVDTDIAIAFIHSCKNEASQVRQTQHNESFVPVYTLDFIGLLIRVTPMCR